MVTVLAAVVVTFTLCAVAGYILLTRQALAHRRELRAVQTAWRCKLTEAGAVDPWPEQADLSRREQVEFKGIVKRLQSAGVDIFRSEEEI